MNLCIDMGSLVRTLFKTGFKSLEGVSVGGWCRLRRVFTLLNVPGGDMDIPRPFHMGPISVHTQVRMDRY